MSSSGSGMQKSERGKSRRQKQKVTVPRILVRPSTEPTGEQSTQPQLQPQSQPLPQHKAPQPKQPTQKHKVPTQQLKPQQQTQLFPVADGRNTYHPVITATGKQLGSSVRSSLGQLSIRSSVGILGRPTSDTRALAAQLADSSWPSTQAIGVWVTGARIALVDAPPVLSTTVAAAWLPRSPRHVTNRVHDLQLTLWMLHTCHTLLVVD
ncbi:hypothetical protein IWW56_004654, partial [Coemansia sp. RSA 2131]